MFGLNGRQLLFLLLLIIVLFAATQYVPGYFAAFQFNDFIRQEVKFAVTAKKTAESIRSSIVAKAKELGIPLTPRDIRITRRGPAFTVEFQYRWPVNMRAYQHELIFNVSESGEIFESAPENAPH